MKFLTKVNMSKLLKIDSLMFLVTDLEKSATFYENTLGLKRRWTDKERNMIGFTFADSDSEIVIHTDKSISKFSYSFLVEGVDKFCREFSNNGGKIVNQPFDVRTGKFAILLDPDGNEIPIIDLTKFGGVPRYEN